MFLACWTKRSKNPCRTETAHLPKKQPDNWDPTYPPESQRCAHRGEGCSGRCHSGSTLGGRNSLRRWASPSRKPASCKSDRCRCRLAQVRSPYVPHTEREESSIYSCVIQEQDGNCSSVFFFFICYMITCHVIKVMCPGLRWYNKATCRHYLAE